MQEGVLGVLVGCLAACVSGCDRPDEAVPAIGIDTVNGVEHVRNPASSAAWQLREAFTIRSAGAEPLGEVAGVISDDHHVIYVADRTASRIHVYDEGGPHIRSIGRKGSRPGEFASINSIAWFRDTLAVMDRGNARVQLITLMGEPLREIPAERSGSPVSFRMAGEDVYSPGYHVDAGVARPILHYAWYRPDRVDTLRAPVWGDNIAPPGPYEGRPMTCTVSVSGEVQSFSHPERPLGSLSVPAPGGTFAFAFPGEYAIRIASPSGDVLRVIEKTYDPIPITEDEWMRSTASYRAYQDSMPAAKCEPTGFARPEHRTAIHDIFFDLDGRMWVEVATRQGLALDIFGSDGTQLGRVPSPPRSRVSAPFARDNYLYVVAGDSADEPGVVVYEIMMSEQTK